MPTDSTQPPVSSQPLPKKRGAHKKAKKRARSYVYCAICHARLPYLTIEHLQTHGYSLERYQRVFLAEACPPSPRADLVRVLAEDLVTRGEFVNVLADEVAEAIFSGPMRDKLRLALTSVISTRLSQHGESAAALAKIRRELSADWRVTAGGELGAPTETRDLVGMAMQSHAEVVKGEELLLKAVKLAIDERKGINERGEQRGGLAAYTGAAEVIPIPADLSPGEREDVRSLLEELTRSVRPREITMEVVSPPVTAPHAASLEQEGPVHAQDGDSASGLQTTPPVSAPLPPPPEPTSSESIDPLAM